MGRFFYNTNGFAFHRLGDVVRILADLGYDGVALTPDVHHLDPQREDASHAAEVQAFRRALETHGLEVVIETGARFVLDPTRKHRPSLLDEGPEAERRLSFLEACVVLAADLDAPIVTVWSGNGPEGLGADEALDRLARGLRPLCEFAAERGIRIGFEPEPGMAIERATQWPEVRDAVGHAALGLTLDVGHCLATGEGDPADAIRAHADDLLVLQLDDHNPGTHEHLAFGEGRIDFASIARAAAAAAFDGPLEVELSRHSSTAPTTAADSIAFLRRVFRDREAAGAP